MKVKGFVRSRMRESRTYGSVRGGYRKVSVYSILEVKYISEQQTIREGRLKYEIWVFIHRLNMADHVICPQYDMDEEQAAGL